MKVAFFSKLAGLLILGLVVTFVIDPLDRSTESTTFCLGIIVMALSLRQSPSLVLVASLIYCVLTVYALIQFHQYHVAHVGITPHPYFWFFQRTGLFLVVCSMAVYLAYYRSASERTRAHLQEIISKLPAPVVISTADGIITYANDAVSTIFNQSPTEIIGKRYVDLFMADMPEDEAGHYYIEVLGDQNNVFNEIAVRPFGCPVWMTARLICMGRGRKREMVTLLSNSEEVSRAASSIKLQPVSP
jgi:PAS domain S-box-containing protein